MNAKNRINYPCSTASFRLRPATLPLAPPPGRAPRVGPVAAADPTLSRLCARAEAIAQMPSDASTAEWETLVDSLAAEELPQVLERLVTARGAASAELRQLLLRRWAAANPTAAAAWAVRLRDPAVQTESLRQVAAVWSERVVS